jgi:hypothetical protein
VKLGDKWDREIFFIKSTGIFLRIWYVFTKKENKSKKLFDE